MGQGSSGAKRRPQLKLALVWRLQSPLTFGTATVIVRSTEFGSQHVRRRLVLRGRVPTTHAGRRRGGYRYPLVAG
jgi:hypothetical protein